MRLPPGEPRDPPFPESLQPHLLECVLVAVAAREREVPGHRQVRVEDWLLEQQPYAPGFGWDARDVLA